MDKQSEFPQTLVRYVRMITCLMGLAAMAYGLAPAAIALPAEQTPAASNSERTADSAELRVGDVLLAHRKFIRTVSSRDTKGSEFRIEHACRVVVRETDGASISRMDVFVLELGQLVDGKWTQSAPYGFTFSADFTGERPVFKGEDGKVFAEAESALLHRILLPILRAQVPASLFSGKEMPTSGKVLTYPSEDATSKAAAEAIANRLFHPESSSYKVTELTCSDPQLEKGELTMYLGGEVDLSLENEPVGSGQFSGRLRVDPADTRTLGAAVTLRTERRLSGMAGAAGPVRTTLHFAESVTRLGMVDMVKFDLHPQPAGVHLMRDVATIRDTEEFEGDAPQQKQTKREQLQEAYSVDLRVLEADAEAGRSARVELLSYDAQGIAVNATMKEMVHHPFNAKLNSAGLAVTDEDGKASSEATKNQCGMLGKALLTYTLLQRLIGNRTLAVGEQMDLSHVCADGTIVDSRAQVWSEFGLSKLDPEGLLDSNLKLVAVHREATPPFAALQIQQIFSPSLIQRVVMGKDASGAVLVVDFEVRLDDGFVYETKARTTITDSAKDPVLKVKKVTTSFTDRYRFVEE